MIATLEIFSWLLTAPILVVLAICSLELLIGLLPRTNQPRQRWGGRLCVLVPAHNEAAGIAATIENLKSAAPVGTEILVVADNCTDQTVAIARACGATVIERDNPVARGKGFAVAFGRDFLNERRAKGPDVLVVFDADCRIHPGSLQLLACEASKLQVPVQAVNLIYADLAAPAMVQISNFAMVVKNLYRCHGMQRMGGAALLTGTGMAFPWSVIKDAPLASDALAEDLELCIAMVRSGRSPRLVTSAAVFSGPASLGNALAQRTRWEHGFLRAVRRNVVPLLAGGILRMSAREFLLGLHLLVPPLALLVLLAVPVLILNGLTFAAGGTVWTLSATVVVFGMLIGAVFGAWLGQGRHYLSLPTLLRAPLYVIWKIPIYLRMIHRPEREWRRTLREDGERPVDQAKSR